MNLPAGTSLLFITKLFISPRRAGLVECSRLAERIDAATQQALALISAPAGFGKTTLLADWAVQGHLPVAWLSLDVEDNDSSRFLGYLAAAVGQALPGAGAAAWLMLGSPQPLPPQAILVSLINDLNEAAGPFALILDDCQSITSPAVRSAWPTFWNICQRTCA